MLTGKYEQYSRLLYINHNERNQLPEQEQILFSCRPRPWEKDKIEVKYFAIFRGILWITFLSLGLIFDAKFKISDAELVLIVIVFYEALFLEMRLKKVLSDYTANLYRWEDRVREMVDRRGY